MERGRLESMTDKELQAEAWRYRLTVRETREATISRILEHMEGNAPIMDVAGQTRQIAAEALPAPQPQRSLGGAPLSRDSMTDVLERLAAAVTLCVQQQQQVLLRLEERPFGPPVANPASATESATLCDPGTRQEMRSGLPRDVSAPTTVALLVPQIPEFGGFEKENVEMWMQRVETVARIHGASDGVTHLAASGRLIDAAKRWYDVQMGAALESWHVLKRELICMFERKVPFYIAIREVEVRLWQTNKETFR